MAPSIRCWALDVGRWTFAALAALVFISCGPEPLKKSSIRYSPPAVYPVRQKVSDAQTHRKTEASAAIGAVKAIEKAKSVAPANVPDLQEALAEASGYVNQLLFANDLLQSSLAGAQKSVDELEQRVGTQAGQLNTCGDDKNAAIDRADKIAKESAITEKKYHRLKFLVCSLATALVCFLAVKLGALKLLSKLAVLGPWGIAGAAAAAIALPSLVFGFLWLKL